MNVSGGKYVFKKYSNGKYLCSDVQKPLKS